MVMTTGSVEDQTRVVLDASTETLAEADFPGFNAVRAEYFPPDPPVRSAVVSELLVDVRVEVVAWRPLCKGQAMHTASALTGPEPAPVVGLIHGLGLNRACSHWPVRVTRSRPMARRRWPAPQVRWSMARP